MPGYDSFHLKSNQTTIYDMEEPAAPAMSKLKMRHKKYQKPAFSGLKTQQKPLFPMLFCHSKQLFSQPNGLICQPKHLAAQPKGINPQPKHLFINTGRVYINRGAVYIDAGAVYKHRTTCRNCRQTSEHSL